MLQRNDWNGGSSGKGNDLTRGLWWLKLSAVMMLVSLILMPLSPSENQPPLVLPAMVQPDEASEGGALSHAGSLYVPLYSSITAGRGTTIIDLAATLSLRNLSPTTPLQIERIDYHDTSGKLVRGYLQGPQVLAPLGTLEVVIADQDVEGGTGAKFLVDWAG